MSTVCSVGNVGFRERALFIVVVFAALWFPVVAQDEPSHSAKIDQLVRAGLETQGLKPNAPVDDFTFLRRVYLAIIGRIPNVDEMDDFHSRSRENKRSEVIDHLLESQGYVSHFYNYWADILRINDGLTNGGNAARPAEAAYELWLKDALESNLPYNEFASRLISAEGKIWENGAVAYYIRDRGMPLENLANTSRIFLGIRLECAQCHDHPFEKWTQMDFYQMAAFTYGADLSYYPDTKGRYDAFQLMESRRKIAFREAAGHGQMPVLSRDSDRLKKPARFDRFLLDLKMTKSEFYAAIERGEKAADRVGQKVLAMRKVEDSMYDSLRNYHIQWRTRGLKLPHDYQYDNGQPNEVISARTMFGEKVDAKTLKQSPITSFADWLTAGGNPTFTRVIANRLWKNVFGRGVFEPVDDITDHTYIANPELMDYLEIVMRDVNYDMRAYLRILFHTQTWQSESFAGDLPPGTPYYFQGPVMRRMTAEQIWDSVIGLVLPEPDLYQPNLPDRLRSIDVIKMKYESVAGLDAEPYIEMTEELGTALEKNRLAQEKVRQKLALGVAEISDKMKRSVQAKLENLKDEKRTIVRRIAYSRFTKSDSPSPAMQERLRRSSVIITLPEPKKEVAPVSLDLKQLKRWRHQQADALRFYNIYIAHLARASALDSPASRGHFLRDFGQSDREGIQNSSNMASIPQALNLLNGSLFDTLTNPYTEFGRKLYNTPDPEGKVRLIFRGMFSRDPTALEMKIGVAEITGKGDAACENLLWALRNTRQFLYIR